MIKKRNNFWD